MEKLAMTVPEAAKALGVSVRTMYEIIHIDGFPKKVMGTTVRIPVKGLEAWLNNGKKETI